MLAYASHEPITGSVRIVDVGPSSGAHDHVTSLCTVATTWLKRTSPSHCAPLVVVVGGTQGELDTRVSAEGATYSIHVEATPSTTAATATSCLADPVARATVRRHYTRRAASWFGLTSYDERASDVLTTLVMVRVGWQQQQQAPPSTPAEAQPTDATAARVPTPPPPPSTDESRAPSDEIMSSTAAPAPPPAVPVAPARVIRWVTAYPPPLYADLCQAVRKRRERELRLLAEFAVQEV